MAFKFPDIGLPLPGRERPASDARPDAAPAAAAGAIPAQPGSRAVRPLVLPFIGHLPATRQFQILGIALAVLLVAAASMIVLDRREAASSAVYVSTATGMQMLSQRIATGAQQAVLGTATAFDQLRESRERFGQDLKLLAEGGERGGIDLPASPEDVQPLLAELAKVWGPVERDSGLILSQREALIELRRNEETVQRAGSQLTGLAQQFLVAVADQGGSTAVATIARQLHADTINFDFAEANRLLSTETPNPSVALQLGRNVRVFRETLASLLEPVPASGIRPLAASPARDKVEALNTAIAPFAASVDGILRNMQALAGAKQAARDIFAASEPLLQIPVKMTAAYEARAGVRAWLIGAAVAFGAAALVCLVLMGKVILDDAERRALENEAANRRTQEAILRLLDEMGDLAQGDLTVKARVTEDVTGAIADSVNYAVEEMRRLVLGITEATEQVTSATGQAQQITGSLLNAAQRQSQEINDTSASVAHIAQSIEDVSNRAAESARVAGQSLAAATQGAEAVATAIGGMNTIREQIQDTAKRIKRLGESSQEIGEIVDIISDIAEQTNVLALNAAIQATTAGPAGRGFTVVAEEVQRLAERSAEATKQISSIVRTIQTDTHDAIGAMERSTQGVVEQTRLADATGRALAQIDEVSRRLATLIEAISVATREQSAAAARITENMTDILRITEMTTDGTRKTADSTARLAALAAELKQSVTGFKLS